MADGGRSGCRRFFCVDPEASAVDAPVCTTGAAIDVGAALAPVDTVEGVVIIDGTVVPQDARSPLMTRARRIRRDIDRMVNI